MEEGLCTLCPRACAVDRRVQKGRCGGGAVPRVGLVAPHFHEEPALSGQRGSGTVFFTGCALGCRFCQNHEISTAPNTGREMAEDELAAAFLALQAKGVHNLNLVTATHYRPGVLAAVRKARQQGFCLPVVWNTSGYENEDAAAFLAHDVQIHLADLKFFSPALSGLLADAPDYFMRASAYLKKAAEQCGPPRFGADGLLLSGVIVRLLVLPGAKDDAIELLRWAEGTLPKRGFLLSLMSQYTPPAGRPLPNPFGRRVSSYEYRLVKEEALRLGLTRGWFQDRQSATEAYLPHFAP